MNIKYIKRQITLDKIGIPMNDDIREYYNYFRELIDIDNLERVIYRDVIFWRKKGKVILEYDPYTDYASIDYDSVWKKFEVKYNLSYNDTFEIIISILSVDLNLDIGKIAYVDKQMKDVSWGILSNENAYE